MPSEIPDKVPGEVVVDLQKTTPAITLTPTVEELEVAMVNQSKVISDLKETIVKEHDKLDGMIALHNRLARERARERALEVSP